ncbi:MAG: PaaI family thioesterase [Thermodesulfobacteriota bacterium]
MKNVIHVNPDTGPHEVVLDRWISCAPFEKLLGLDIVEAKDGRSYLTMPFMYQLAQGQGMAHGGAIVTLADTAVAMAIKSRLPPGSRFGTISLNAEFLGPVTQGVLTARAEVTPVENRQVQGYAEVTDDDGRPVMRFSAIFKLGREVTLLTQTAGE